MLIDPIAFFCWNDIVSIVVWFQDWSRGTTLFKGCHRVPFTREKVPKSAVFMILEALQAHQVRTIVFRFRPMGCNLFWAQAAGSWLYTMGVPFFLQYSNLWYWTPRIFCVFWSNVVDISPPRFSFSEAKTIRQKSAFFHLFRFSKPVFDGNRGSNRRRIQKECCKIGKLSNTPAKKSAPAHGSSHHFLNCLQLPAVVELERQLKCRNLQGWLPVSHFTRNGREPLTSSRSPSQNWQSPQTFAPSQRCSIFVSFLFDFCSASRWKYGEMPYWFPATCELLITFSPAVAVFENLRKKN